MIEVGQMVEEATSAECDLTLVIHCASLAARLENILVASFPGLSWEPGNEHNAKYMEPQENHFFIYMLHIPICQGNGDTFKSQSIYEGILSARCNMFTCIICCLSFQFVVYPFGLFVFYSFKFIYLFSLFHILLENL